MKTTFGVILAHLGIDHCLHGSIPRYVRRRRDFGSSARRLEPLLSSAAIALIKVFSRANANISDGATAYSNRKPISGIPAFKLSPVKRCKGRAHFYRTESMRARSGFLSWPSRSCVTSQARVVAPSMVAILTAAPQEVLAIDTAPVAELATGRKSASAEADPFQSVARRRDLGVAPGRGLRGTALRCAKRILSCGKRMRRCAVRWRAWPGNSEVTSAPRRRLTRLPSPICAVWRWPRR